MQEQVGACSTCCRQAGVGDGLIKVRQHATFSTATPAAHTHTHTHNMVGRYPSHAGARHSPNTGLLCNQLQHQHIPPANPLATAPSSRQGHALRRQAGQALQALQAHSSTRHPRRRVSGVMLVLPRPGACGDVLGGISTVQTPGYSIPHMALERSLPHTPLIAEPARARLRAFPSHPGVSPGGPRGATSQVGAAAKMAALA